LSAAVVAAATEHSDVATQVLQLTTHKLPVIIITNFLYTESTDNIILQTYSPTSLSSSAFYILLVSYSTN